MRAQTKLEERLNTCSHAIGVVLGIAALPILILQDSGKTTWSLFTVIIYGLSIIILFLASTMYHSVRDERRKYIFRIIDHISIYLLIAGTYTPVLLITLVNSRGWPLFMVVWGIATIGTTLKLFYTGRFEIFSTLLYLVMGWLIVFDFSALSAGINPLGIVLLFTGGLAYTIGIVFYIMERIPFNHVVWHVLVLIGAICHFFMILFYVI
jgi:hemolysin III